MRFLLVILCCCPMIALPESPVLTTYTMQSAGDRAICLQHDEALWTDGVLWGWNPYPMGRTDLDLGYNLDAMPLEHRETCREALWRWKPAGRGIQMTLTERPAGSEKTIVFIWEPMRWGTNYGLLGQAQFPWLGGPSSTIRINSSADWSRFSMLHVLTHEIGHALGLVHVSEPGSVMQPMYTGQLSPSFRDYMRAAELYTVRPLPSWPYSQTQ